MYSLTENFETLSLILLITLVTSLGVQLCYFLFFYLRLALHKNHREPADQAPVSVIICAKNEYQNLKTNLIPFLEQNYHEFQVIVVNDCSWDQSGELLAELESRYTHLKVITIVEQEKYIHGKKFALTLGIKGASNELLVLSDADCIPAGKNWLAHIQSRFYPEKEIVLGYGPYKKEGGILNSLIRFDAFYTAMQYFSMCLANLPYMGVGRNLAYRRGLFFSNKGFASHNHLLSGDDDLFINETARKGNVEIEISRESFTYSVPEKTWGGWIHQKKRHMTTGFLYKFWHKFLLSIIPFTSLVFYSSLIALFVLNFDWQILMVAYFIRLFFQLLIFGRCMKKLGESDLILWIPFMDLFFTLFSPMMALSAKMIKTRKWK